MLSNQNIILKGPIHKAVLKLALPIMLANLMQTLYNLADTFWVGRYEIINGLEGELLSSIILTFPAIGITLALGMGISAACISLISQYIGSNNAEEAKHVSGQALTFAFISSIIIGFLGVIFTSQIVSFLGGSENHLIFVSSTKYLRIMLGGLPSLFLFFTFNAIKQAQGDTLSPMIFSFISVILNVILDPIFMIHLDMGISGAAYATVLSRGIFIIFAIISLFKTSKKHVKLDLNDLKLNPKIMNKIISIGVPASLSSATASLGFAVLNGFILSFGFQTLTAFGIGNRITGLILMPAMGIGNALSAIVGQNLGANNVKRAKEAVKTSFLLSTIILILGGVVIFTSAEFIVLQFTKIPIIVEQATYYLKLIIATIPLMAGFSILQGTFTGSGHTKLALLISGGRLWLLRIPMIYLLKTYTSLGSNLIWYSMILSNLIICIIGYIIYQSGIWEKRVIE